MSYLVFLWPILLPGLLVLFIAVYRLGLIEGCERTSRRLMEARRRISERERAAFQQPTRERL